MKMGWVVAALKIFPLIIGAVQAVEKIAGSKKGKEKQDAAIEAIGAMINAIEIGVSKEIMNEQKFQELLRRLIDDYVAVQNFIWDFQKKEATSLIT